MASKERKMKPHKWHKEIKAWADGAEIEARNYSLDEACSTWNEWTVCEVPAWWENCWEFRIKPQPKEDDVNDSLKYFIKSQSDNIKAQQDTIKGYQEIIQMLNARLEKPQPKEPQYLYVFRTSTNGQTEYKLWDDKDTGGAYIGKIKLEIEDA